MWQGLLFLLVASLATCSASGFQIVNVSFWSNASSGNVTIYGSIVFPSGAPPAGGFKPAIMIGGSGPGTRWENETYSMLSTNLYGEEDAPFFPGQKFNLCYYMTQLCAPFYDIATHLASTTSMAILVWDKRTCTTTHGCPNNHICVLPGQTDCVHVNRLLNSDFVTDSINALNYLLTQTGVPVNPTSAAVIGHSAGCWQVPMVATAFPTIVDQGVLLMGSAIPILTTLNRQFSNSAAQCTAILDGALCDPSDPGQATMLKNMQQCATTSQQQALSIQEQQAAFQSGAYDQDGPWTIIDVGGAKLPLLFWQQAINMTSFSSTQSMINSYLGSSAGNTLLAINSEQDQQVSPYEFYPLRTILHTSPFGAQARHMTIPYKTHMLNDSSNLSGKVAESVLYVLTKYFNSSLLNR